MKLIIAGSRDILDRDLVFQHIEEGIKELGIEVTEVVSGKALGVDTLGERWAELKGIKVVPFPANWRKHGKAAGYRRNVQMAKYGEALIAITTGSSGTAHMIEQAEKNDLKVFVKKWMKTEDEIDWLTGDDDLDKPYLEQIKFCGMDEDGNDIISHTKLW